MQRCVFCRAFTGVLLAKIGVDTAENELRVNPNLVCVLRVTLRVIRAKILRVWGAKGCTAVHGHRWTSIGRLCLGGQNDLLARKGSQFLDQAAKAEVSPEALLSRHDRRTVRPG